MRIAIIEDDHVQMESLSGLVRGELASYGHLGGKIDAFESGEAFLSSWRAGVYDLVILDNNSPVVAAQAGAAGWTANPGPPCPLYGLF